MPRLSYLLAILRRSGLVIGPIALTVSIVGIASAALGQDQSGATVRDAIIARKTVMNTLSDKMDVIEAMIASGRKIDLDEAHANADAISVYLSAFPHLFPPSTNLWKPDGDKDPATDTFAAPEVWTKFSDFYRRATAASKNAFNASRATDETGIKASIAQLRTGCKDCHAAYLKAN